jgi:hypothetical protein
MRVLTAAVAVAAAFLAGGCTADTGDPAVSAHTPASVSASPLPPDLRTQSALFKIASAFNHAYDTGHYATVYVRWDARSKAVISEAGYNQRHKDCPGAPHALSMTETASPGSHGAWLVNYEIGGQQLTDYWFYVDRRWVFDLVLSNPDAVKLYRMTPKQYAAAVGCAH